jgi:hypothetical protein
MLHAVLERHSAAPCAALRGIQVSVELRAMLEVRYVLEGDIAGLRIPHARAPRIAEGLWRHTCCELFLMRPGEKSYRELNFSPSGEWAAYEFSRYREGGPLAVPDPGIRLRQEHGRLELEAAVAVPARKIRVGLSAVIEDREGNLSYWALRHAPGKPDFHHPDAFALELDEVRH